MRRQTFVGDNALGRTVARNGTREAGPAGEATEAIGPGTRSWRCLARKGRPMATIPSAQGLAARRLLGELGLRHSPPGRARDECGQLGRGRAFKLVMAGDAVCSALGVCVSYQSTAILVSTPVAELYICTTMFRSHRNEENPSIGSER